MSPPTDQHPIRRTPARPLDRVDNVRAAGAAFQAQMLRGKPVPYYPYYRSMELVRVPYPAKFGYLNGFGTLPPFITSGTAPAVSTVCPWTA